jgi:hypothetical protein
VERRKILKQALSSNGRYTVCCSIDGRTKTQLVHQLVAIAFLNHTPNGHKLVVDHIDNNHLNNKLTNLQIITQRENLAKVKRGSSKYTGVCFCNTHNVWKAHIWIGGKNKYLGSFKYEEDAYNKYQKELDNLK